MRRLMRSSVYPESADHPSAWRGRKPEIGAGPPHPPAAIPLSWLHPAPAGKCRQLHPIAGEARQEISMECDPSQPTERDVDDEFPDATDPRDPDLPAPEGWQLPSREIRF